MHERDVLICTKQYRDGSVQVEHRDGKGFLLATYIGYYRNGGVYQLYPMRGERHRDMCLAGKKISPRLIEGRC